jgi:predicted ABC-type transport system involved in lysophospholipase L1 biosynthesis ATPase subunit
MSTREARAAEASQAALWYEPPPDGPAGRIWIPAGTKHRTVAVSQAFKSRFVAALLELEAQPGAWLAVLGFDAATLPAAERRALRARIAFLPAGGGMISNLNGWENIVLPLGYRDAGRIKAAAPQVNALIERLGGSPRALLAKLPEEMTLYEKKLSGYVRILLEAPELVVAENLAGGLEPDDRRRAAAFPAAYHAQRPDGLFVQLEDAPDE